MGGGEEMLTKSPKPPASASRSEGQLLFDLLNDAASEANGSAKRRPVGTPVLQPAFLRARASAHFHSRLFCLVARLVFPRLEQEKGCKVAEFSCESELRLQPLAAARRRYDAKARLSRFTLQRWNGTVSKPNCSSIGAHTDGQTDKGTGCKHGCRGGSGSAFGSFPPPSPLRFTADFLCTANLEKQHLA